MGCRDMEKCQATAKEIRGSTLNRHVYASQLDLSSLKSIREFAEKIRKGIEIEIDEYGNRYRNKTHSVKILLSFSRGAACRCSDKQCWSYEMSCMEDRRWL